MAVYRLSPAHALRLRKELHELGVAAQVEHYTAASYLIINSDRDDVTKLITTRPPNARLVANLKV